MKKKLFLTVGVFLLIFITFIGYWMEDKGKNIVIESRNTKVFIEKKYLNKVEMISFVIKAERGVDRVKKYLGEENIKHQGKVNIYLREGSFVSTGHGGVVTLSYVKEREDPYIHELVHVLAGAGRSGWWIREGFAVYLNDTFSVNSLPNFGKDLHELSRLYLEKGQYKEVLGMDGKGDYVHFGKTRRADYTFCGSLVKFIIENYGKEYFFKLYNEENLDFFLREEGRDILEEWKGKLAVRE